MNTNNISMTSYNVKITSSHHLVITLLGSVSVRVCAHVCALLVGRYCGTKVQRHLSIQTQISVLTGKLYTASLYLQSMTASTYASATHLNAALI